MPEFQFLPDLSLSASSQQEQLLALLLLIFTETPPAETEAELRYRQARGPVQVWLAEVKGQLVGCKLGYERVPGHYYSWLGGVLPAYRGQGLAAELMRRQHTWCLEQGYGRVRTQTYNQWRAMLLLNLRHGFDIIGTLQGTYGLTIVLEKKLTA